MAMLVSCLVLSLAVSFLCSLAESVLLTVRASFVALMIKSGHKSGRIFKKLKDNIDRPLSAILTLNTIANTAGATIVGAQVQKIYGEISLTAVSFGLTFLFLVCSEIIPKTIGASQWRRLAPSVAYIIRAMIWATYPVVLAVEFFSKKITENSIYPRMTREEFIVVAEMGHVEGVLLEKEAHVIKNLLHLNNVPVSDVMTPYSVVFMLPAEKSVADVITDVQKSFFSRIPVYEKSKDNVLGMVLRTRLLQVFGDSPGEAAVGSLVMPIHTILENESVAVCLDLFIKRHEHLFLVKNRQGKMVGVITLEDTIETLLGVEIVDEKDHVVDMHKLADEDSFKTIVTGGKESPEAEKRYQLLA